jgi:hypothetical protein
MKTFVSIKYLKQHVVIIYTIYFPVKIVLHTVLRRFREFLYEMVIGMHFSLYRLSVHEKRSTDKILSIPNLKEIHFSFHLPLFLIFCSTEF